MSKGYTKLRGWWRSCHQTNGRKLL